jgi:deazaflavin-dependent oxidoreductase (nitroreductase family)
MKHGGSQADRALIRVSRGRLSISGPAMPTMLLTTKGRKSGKERTVPVYYVRDGKNLVSVCENFGLDTASSWPMNLRADPKARVED